MISFECVKQFKAELKGEEVTFRPGHKFNSKEAKALGLKNKPDLAHEVKNGTKSTEVETPPDKS